MISWRLALFLFFSVFSPHAFSIAEERQASSLYTSGWFYLPGIDRSIEEVLVIELKNGEVLIELFEEDAPQHVSRIKELAASGDYDDVVFHRVIDGFMVQTGDVQYGKKSDFNSSLVGTGGSKLPDLSAEFNLRPHLRGICSMARSSDPNSANSQFFICLGDSTYLDRQYSVWGRVVDGMEHVDAIKKGDAGQNGKVENPDEMKRVYLRQLDQSSISGWLYSDQSVYPYFYDAQAREWVFFDDSTCAPRFYSFSKKDWLSLDP